MVIIAQRPMCTLYTHFTWPFGFLIALECSNCKFIALPYRPYRKIWFEKCLTYMDILIHSRKQSQIRQWCCFCESRGRHRNERWKSGVRHNCLPAYLNIIPSLCWKHDYLRKKKEMSEQKKHKDSIKIKRSPRDWVIKRHTVYHLILVSMVQKWRGFA